MKIGAEVMENKRTPDIRRIHIFPFNWLVVLLFWSAGRKKNVEDA